MIWVVYFILLFNVWNLVCWLLSVNRDSIADEVNGAINLVFWVESFKSRLCCFSAINLAHFVCFLVLIKVFKNPATWFLLSRYRGKVKYFYFHFETFIVPTFQCYKLGCIEKQVARKLRQKCSLVFIYELTKEKFNNVWEKMKKLGKYVDRATKPSEFAIRLYVAKHLLARSW